MVTRRTALLHLRKLFPNPSKTLLTIEEAYVAGRRNMEETTKNRSWLRNKVHYFRYYNFVTHTYEIVKGSPYLASIQLTEEGQKALNEPIDDSEYIKRVSPTYKAKLKSQESITNVIKALIQEFPDRKITYDYKAGTISVY